MFRKILAILVLLFLTGCSMNIENMTYQNIIESSIEDNIDYSNVNAVGYKYYLPINFNVYKDDVYNQVLTSNNDYYYLNVDVVSYHYKKSMKTMHELDDYVYYTFEKDGKNGYLRITKNNDYFFVELCYNYAIIEVEVEEEDLKYAISRSIIILNSIKYNDLVIEKNIVEDNIETGESKYSIPQPENKSSSKNVLEYIKENDG